MEEILKMMEEEDRELAAQAEKTEQQRKSNNGQEARPVEKPPETTKSSEPVATGTTQTGPVSKIGGLTRQIMESDYETARHDLFMVDATVAGDLFYENAGAFLSSEINKTAATAPLYLFRHLRDIGYASAVLSYTSINQLFVMRCLMSLFGHEDRELHGRTVTMVFRCEGTPGLKTAARFVNYIFGDADITKSELRMYPDLQ